MVFLSNIDKVLPFISSFIHSHTSDVQLAQIHIRKDKLQVRPLKVPQYVASHDRAVATYKQGYTIASYSASMSEALQYIVRPYFY
jgi:hypothetical protein